MDLDIFNIKHNTIKPDVGKILVSVPFVDDTFFHKSVVYIVSHDDEGSVGYILNKPLPMKLHELVDDVPKSNFPVHIGGPVSHNTLNMLHTIGDIIPNSTKIAEGLYWGGDFEVVKQLMKKKLIQEKSIRFFLGYSGWSPHQLHSEVEEDTWLVHSINKHQLMSEIDEQMWERILIKMGDKYKVWAGFPDSPSLN